ncbi:MAG: hypothetical protein PVI30_26950 [Myxococcales bacterium]|jgi:hypothetical protein
MNRWLLLSSCVLVLVAVFHAEPSSRPAGAGPLGAVCTTDRDCQHGLECTYVPGVMEAQCSASCNATDSCQERFGSQSMCLGADLCARSCGQDADCPDGIACNAYGWCEG